MAFGDIVGLDAREAETIAARWQEKTKGKHAKAACWDTRRREILRFADSAQNDN